MSLTTLMNEVDDVTLLTRSDEWLDHERRSIATKMDNFAHELKAIMVAQRIKNLLQQKNLVAVQQILEDSDGNAIDIVIKLLPLPQAIALLKHGSKSEINKLNNIAQLYGWDKDGYDVETCAAMSDD